MIARQSETILSEDNWRIHCWNPPVDAGNIQIQGNNVPNASTVAGVPVPDILTAALTTAPKGPDHGQREKLFGSRMREPCENGKPNGRKRIKMQRFSHPYTI